MIPNTFNAYGIVNLILLFGLPLLVALVTKRVTHAGIKAVLLLLLSAIGSVLNEWLVHEGPFHWAQVIYAATLVFLGGCVAHFGLWRPTGVQQTFQNSLVK